MFRFIYSSFILIILLIFISFSNSVLAESSLTSETKKIAENSLSSETKKINEIITIAKSANKKPKKKSSSPKNTVKKTGVKRTSASALEKEDILPPNYYQPKIASEILIRQLDDHLNKINLVCSNKNLNQLVRNINQLRDFLNKHLSTDPYMNIDIKILFSNILGIIGEDPTKKVLKSTDFTSSYRFAFNLNEELEISTYPHKWAIHVEKALICAERIN